MKIVLEDDIPVYQRPRRTSYENKCFIEKQVQEWLAEGIIVPSSSEYASPVVLVAKRTDPDDFVAIIVDLIKKSRRRIFR